MMPRSPRCQTAIDYANKAHRRLGAPCVTSGHLVVGLLTLTGGVGDTVLKRAGLSSDEVERYLSSGRQADERTTGQEGALFGRSAMEALARAETEAAAFSHAILGVEHLTLALLSEEHGDAAELFALHHIDREKMRQTILQEMQ